MELKEYISESLIQICEGIRFAQKRIGVISTPTANDVQIIAPSDDVKKCRDINFEICLTIKETKNSKVGAGVSTSHLLEVIGLSGSVGGKTSQNNTNENLQKISFNIGFLPYLLNKKS